MKIDKTVKKILLFFDPWSHIPAKKKAILDSSWPGLFRKQILPELPALKPASKLGLKPKELSGDQSYGGDDNVEAAKKIGMEVISPVKKGPEGRIGLLDFKMDSSGDGSNRSSRS
ncbi:hypothetical protein EPICR_170057 [Candidatus Desulfarcum epimagneticum]|uniref:Transposase n=1 Tax=uncultured Desulfobacteraceae bacterium TaxID=218296 RepID=A0A484HG87_9BACT|nr:hypothetical protein EPICR_170057 [uncultured Desulfobacteraceae bacterium]